MPSLFLNDLDFVCLTQYTVPPRKKAKTPAPKLWKLPTFNMLNIDNFHFKGAFNIPLGLNNSDSFALFRLFFTNKIVDNIVEWINMYTEHH